ncbi:MAG TPA: M14 family zinc carboxypeptidase [Gaiellaceae bacterium]|nr:M14 family zinc carboxypeptidase [Gaiellaceae bacterium]
MNTRRLILWLLLAAALAVPALASSAGAAIAPPWCGTPMSDAAASLPDGSQPTDPPGSFPHIPYYAVGCTLDSIAAQSNGRMTVQRFGHSALGRDKYEVVINELGTKEQRKSFDNWEQVRRYALDNPEKAQKFLAHAGSEIKVPLFVQGGIHGNEYEGVDAAMQVIERLATTPYGTDPEVDRILDHAIVIFNPVQNPDGRIAGTRTNGNGFDLNRDFLTQSQPEVQSTVQLIQKWLSPELLDLHGYVTPTLIEATTKPHNPGIEYDMWLKWNQARIDANEAAMNAQGFQVTRPINDWCADGSIPSGSPLVCDDGTTNYGPKWAESWDDWGPFYTPMYSQLVGLNGSTVEMCNSTSTVTGSSPPRTPCGPLVSENEKVGRRGSRMAQYITVWSTLLFDTANRHDLMHDQLEIYRRGVTDAARPPLSSFPPDFQQPENYWMTEYPKAYVIPKGEGQRSEPEARRLVRWLLANGIDVQELHKGYQYGAMHLEAGTWVVFMDQALRGLADTALGPGQDVTPRISILYAPPGAWSHGFLWGADVFSVPDSATFAPKTKPVESVGTGPGGVLGASGATAFALELDSATAVRTMNQLLADGVTAELATAPFTNALGEQMPAGTIILPASAQSSLAAAGEASGVFFIGIAGALPAREPIDRSPRIAVLTAAVTQEIWVLRNLGFTADPIGTGATSALNNPAAPNPLDGYDVVFNTATWPTGTTARARLTAFFAAGGGYLGALTNGAGFLTAAGQVTGLTAANRGGAGRSGIVYWNNSASGTGLITGAYRGQDTAIMDPPTWFTGVPASWTVDGSLPLTGFFLSGLWPIAGDLQSATAPGSPVVAHGLNAGGTARMAAFAMNPLYRADPEREWPMISSAALWADQ